MKQRSCIAMLLAGGKGTRLNPLTKDTVKPAVPFGGKYRIIDFTLSNCRNSGIETVGILTQYKPHFLHSYLGNGSHWELNKREGGLTVLPPYQKDEKGMKWYEGTSHAVFQNIEYIEGYDPEYVLILSGDHIYKMDYNLMIEQHRTTNADVTVSVVEVPWEEAGRFGIIKMNEINFEITDFEEKPIRPSSNLASMGVYVFKWAVLKKYLIKEEQKKLTSRDFGKNIIPSMLKDGLKICGYFFDKYWKDVGTIQSYWEANIDLLNNKKNIFLQDPNWQIYTAQEIEPPLFLDKSAKIQQSIVNEGCEIYGEVEGSVLFSGVKVGKGSVIRNSVILPQTTVEDHVYIENAVIGSKSLIKYGVSLHAENPYDLTVIGNNETIESDNTNKVYSRVI